MRKLFLLLLISSVAAQGVRYEKWSFNTGDYIVASPMLYDGMILVGSANGMFYALNSTTGELIWQFGKVGKIQSSPAVSKNMVFFGSNDGNLYALWLNGTLAWKFQTKDKILSSPAVSEKMVFFSSNQTFYALWLNGTLAWKFQTKDKILSSPAVAYDVVYFGSSDGNFYALEAINGRLMWNYSGYLPFSSSPLAHNWIVYAGSDEGKLYAFHAFNGTVLWSRKFPGKIQSAFSISKDNLLFFPCKDGNIYAVYAGDGSSVWNISTGTEAQSNVYYSSETGMVYFGTTDSNIYGVKPDGVIDWKYQTGNWVIATPVLKDGLLYVGSYDGRVYAVSTTLSQFPSHSINVTGSPVVINGNSSADYGVGYVQVRVEGGEWLNATGKERWSFTWDTSSVEDGDYIVEARTIDAKGNVELPPYSRLLVHFTKKPVLKQLVVSFSETVVAGSSLKFEVKDSEGNPVPYPEVMIFGKKYVGNERGVVEKDERGNPIKAEKEGEFTFNVSKEGYETKELKIKVVKVFDVLPYAAGGLILLVVLLVGGYMLLKKFRRKQ
ncbi:MAG: PQQ-binding-like beta-propeller repeat protein [Candidatus Micrarchaeia archaeon]